MKKMKRNRAALRGVLLSILLLCFLSLTSISAEENKYNVSIDTSSVIQSDFLGVGINVIPTSLMKGTTQYGYTDSHWEIDRKRIINMKPKVARIWFQIDWMEKRKGEYDWETPEMLAFYKYLDAFKEAGTEIEFNFGWKVGSDVYDWFVLPGVDPNKSAPADLDAYADSVSAALEELIINKGYDNIKYLSFYNEPNGDWDFEVPGDENDEKAYYAEMVKKASEQLSEDGLRDLVEIWGPEETGAPDWTQYMKDNIDDHIDGYSFHVYGASYDQLTGLISDRLDYVSPKSVHLTEFGWSDDDMSDWDGGYANTVIKAANMGVSSALMWQLNGVWMPDPYSGTNGNYAMWNSIVLGMEPRKTYYIAGLLNRYIPEHSTVINVDTGSPDMRAAAFKTDDDNYTILLETKAGSEKNVTFDFNELNIDKTFYKYVFNDNIEKDGNAILPTVVDSFEANTLFNDPSIDSNYNVVIYTTEQPQTQVEVSPLTTTMQSGDKLQLEAEVIDNSGGVTWSIVGKKNGAINKNTGVYHAPQVTDEKYIAIRATSNSDPTSYGVVLVKVLPKSLPNTVEVPTFSLEPGLHPSSEALFLESKTEGAEIRYTMDGSTPTKDSQLYTKPIILKDGTHQLFKAKAFKQGLKPSGLHSALYVLNQVSNGPESYQFCMYEGDECSFEGEAIVAFGADGLFNYAVHTDGVSCSSEIFGDPNPGVDKRCFYSYEIPDEIPVVTIYNSGFEKPGTTSYQKGPMTNGWEFNDRAGVQHNNSAFQPAPAPQGVRTAFLQTANGDQGTISQVINFTPGTYQMEFKAAERTNYGGRQSFDVYLDNEVIGSYEPSSGSFETFRTAPFSTDGGKHMIKFVATTTEGDNTAFIDDVRITLPQTPEDPYLPNTSFESPAVVNDSNTLYGPTAGWQFNDYAGIVRNNNEFDAMDAPIGVQAAFLQSNKQIHGEFSSDARFPAGTYAISFKAANGSVEGEPSFDVMIGNLVVGSYQPKSTSYQTYVTDFFTVEEGSQLIKFIATTNEEGIALIDGVSIEKITIPEYPILSNSSFETPAVTTDHGIFNGEATYWDFNERAGLFINGSVFGAPDAPEGIQAVYLQTAGGISGQFSQSLVFPTGSYVINFQAANRENYGQQSFDVYFDDKLIGSYVPNSKDYVSYQTDKFEVNTPGKYAIKFVATTKEGDNTAFLDAISISTP